MIELKNVSKIYRTRDVQEVRALDNVSVEFPETGLVFLLGKSGSGKSTMLNVVGGLDAFDGGEIIVKGRSSTTFSERDFDSYRNTYIGFIFQDYNILDDFTVAKNIALALELQGKDASVDAVNNILEMVDLTGYGKRKPNQLSGGQKQRVAIARALIKNPEIVMADEPTGALDSATGKQVFETLKKLSESRLVIVVSHDSDYAETYGDRIITMHDGKIWTDVSKRKAPVEVIGEGVKISGDTLFIAPNYVPSKKEKELIVERLFAENTDGVVISRDKIINTNFKKFAKMDEDGNREYFNQTTEEDFKRTKNDGVNLIRSRFKFWDSFKMGASGLKLKKVRLAFTIILAVFALTLFGVADTAGSFNAASSIYESIVIQGDEFVGIAKREVTRHEDSWGSWYNSRMRNISETEREYIESRFPNHSIIGAYGDLFHFPFFDSAGWSYYQTNSSSLFYLNFAELGNFGLSLMHGEFPLGDNQIAITDFHFDNFRDLGFQSPTDSSVRIAINSPSDIIGRYLHFEDFSFQISGIINTYFDFQRYAFLKTVGDGSWGIDTWMLIDELHMVLQNGFSNSLFLNSNNYVLREREPVVSMWGDGFDVHFSVDTGFHDWGWRPGAGNMTRFDAARKGRVIFFNENQTTLGANQVIIGGGGDLFQLIESLGIDSPYHLNWMISNSGIGFDYAYWYECICDSWYECENGGWSHWREGTNWHTNMDSFRDDLTRRIRGNFDIGNIFTSMNMSITTWGDWNATTTNLQIVGVYFDFLNMEMEDAIRLWDQGGYWNLVRSSSTVFLSYELIDNNPQLNSAFNPNPYTALIAQLVGTRSVDFPLIQFISNFDRNESGFVIRNQFSSFYENFVGVVSILSTILFWIGFAFAVFSALLISSFISMTISYKKREIGILRAIGARKWDIYKIFFNESLIINAINVSIAVILSFITIFVLNPLIGGGLGLNVVLLSFGFRQIGLIAGVGILVAAIASFLPTFKINRLKPIDAIYNRK